MPKKRWVKRGTPAKKGYRKTGRTRAKPNDPSSKVEINSLVIKDLQGRPEMEKVRLRYATTSAFTIAGGAASYLQIKANSVYRPWPANTDSAGGQATLFSLYRKCMVYASRIDVRLWSDTAGNSEPFRAVIAPCTSSQYTGYSAATNIVHLVDNPNFHVGRYAPGDKLLHVSHTAYTSQIYLGANIPIKDMLINTNYTGTSGVDPSAMTYFLVGLQAFAGTSSLDCQLEGIIEFDCLFFEPISTNMTQ